MGRNRDLTVSPWRRGFWIYLPHASAHSRTTLTSSITCYGSTLCRCENALMICQKWLAALRARVARSLAFSVEMEGIAAGAASAAVLVSLGSWCRDCHRYRLRARRQPLSGLQDVLDALRPPDPPLAASSSICHAPCRNDGAGTFLHMHVEPVQSSRTKGGGSRKQGKEESGIRVSICDEAHLLP